VPASVPILTNARLAFAILGLALVLSVGAVIRIGDFSIDPVPQQSGDDWYFYHQYAVSIVRSGWTMPGHPGAYERPGGFLYNYFIALVFLLTGSFNSNHVYVVQAALVAVSAGLMTLAARSVVQPRTVLLFGAIVTVSLLLDVYKYYAFRLLSENLLIPLLGAWWVAVLAAFRQPRSNGRWAASGALLGACVLTRPNLLPFAAGAVALVWLTRARCGVSAAGVASLALSAAGTLLFLVVRDRIVGGQWGFHVLTFTGSWEDMKPFEWSKEWFAWAASFYAKRTLFALGITQPLAPEFRLRPIWIAGWFGTVVFLWRSRLRLQPWQWLMVAFIALYTLPMVAVGQISNYGFRMVMPVIPAVLLLACCATDPDAGSRRTVDSRRTHLIS
jgi:hypothetical protein